MPRTAGWRTAIALLGCAVTVLGWALVRPSPPSGTAPSPEPPASWSLVGLGDSITSGQGCPSCAPFVDLFAREITRTTSIPIGVTNLGVSGSTSTDLLVSLSAEQPAASWVREADIITVTIGANDFAPQLETALSGRCGGTDGLGCFASALSKLGVNLTAILRRITELRGDRPTVVRVTGYWNVFLDGEVAAQTYDAAFARSSDELTRRVNTVIRQVTDDSQAKYVDLYRPFKGETGDYDDTPLLAGDGDHPSQAGHLQIAESLANAGYAPIMGRSLTERNQRRGQIGTVKLWAELAQPSALRSAVEVGV